MENLKIEFTKVENDVNGNPRYVCHFLDIPLTDLEKEEVRLSSKRVEGQINTCYSLTVKKAKTIGGKKYNNKSYGGGIVFQSYNLHDLEKKILSL